MHILYWIGLSFILFGLTSCTTVTEPPLPENQTKSWDNRVQTLSEVQNWNLEALISIRNQTKSNSGSTNLQWHQSRGHYTILFFGPFGAGTVKLTGKPGYVLMEGSDGKKTEASTPEILLAKETGWNVPVSNLYYWVRGLPVPNLPAKTKHDAFNHLVLLEQQGWSVQYLQYTSVNHVDVPTKIFLNNSQMSVKMMISQWNFSATSH